MRNNFNKLPVICLATTALLGGAALSTPSIEASAIIAAPSDTDFNTCAPQLLNLKKPNMSGIQDPPHFLQFENKLIDDNFYDHRADIELRTHQMDTRLTAFKDVVNGTAEVVNCPGSLSVKSTVRLSIIKKEIKVPALYSQITFNNHAEEAGEELADSWTGGTISLRKVCRIAKNYKKTHHHTPKIWANVYEQRTYTDDVHKTQTSALRDKSVKVRMYCVN